MSTAPLTKPHAFPSFYACYLLRSLKKKYTSRTYVGSTPNPARRIRQHNGEITAGARKTARYRPWEMVCIVYGFPSQLAALQFEWAWQNPHISRQMPQATKQVLYRTREDRDTSPGQRRRGGKGKNRRLRPSLTMSGKLANMHSMLTLDAWSRWPLKVKVFSEDVWNVWNGYAQKKGVPSLPPWITVDLDVRRECLAPLDAPEVASPSAITDLVTEEPDQAISQVSTGGKAPSKLKTVRVPKKPKPPKPPKVPSSVGGVINLDVLDKPMSELQVRTLSYMDEQSKENLACRSCQKHMDVIDQAKILICHNSDCNHTYHISCMAEHFLKDDEHALLPTQGTCPSCSTLLNWGDLIKGAHFRHLLKTKGVVEVDQDEFADLEFDGQTDVSMTESSASDMSSEDEPLMTKVKSIKASRSRSKSPKAAKNISKHNVPSATAVSSTGVVTKAPTRKRTAPKAKASQKKCEVPPSDEILIID